MSQDNTFHTPDWAGDAIWYQIMVDRFRNGNPGNDPPATRPWTSEWFTPAEWEGRDGQTFYHYYAHRRHYGGDLDGLEEKLPYLRELGVNALYLNPVFKAESHHKYDAQNYLHIDDHFGSRGDYDQVAAGENLLDPSTWRWTPTDLRFLDFLRAAHSQGFRVIIDGVFNHVGRDHPAFQDVLKNGDQSPYADWFDVTSWEPFAYRGWADHPELPVFKKSPQGLASDTLKQHIFNVTRRWMAPHGDPADGIDGWRLDVPNEIPMPFWPEWRAVVKSVNSQAYITGEIWVRADAWLDGRSFDAVMNYGFAEAATAWIFDRRHKIGVSEFDQRLRRLRTAYPHAATMVMQNLIGSHDTDRAVSMAHNPDRAYNKTNRPQDNGPRYCNAKPSATEYARLRLVALLQMTYVGAPMIYYGDEAGMWGSADPTCRKPMLWEDLQPYERAEENAVLTKHLEFYRTIIALRNAHSALRGGTFHTLLADDDNDVWAFLRKDDREQLVVALNASTQPRDVSIPLPIGAPGSWRTLLGMSESPTLPLRSRAGHPVVVAHEGQVRVEVPALGGCVLAAE